MQRLTITAVTVAWLVGVPSAQVRVTGQAGALLTASDVADISRLAKGDPWWLEAQRSQVLPEKWIVFAYLRPDSESGRVRQGQVIELESLVVANTSQAWTVTATDLRYGQVAIPGSPLRLDVLDTGLDRPFHLTRRFSDEELVSLVDYVRSSPPEPQVTGPDGSIQPEYPDRLDGALPITDVVRTTQNHVVVFLASSHSHGQRAELEWRDDAWRITKLTYWIA